MIKRTQRGFSLVELVVVIIIIAILAAMAIPRLSRGSAGASDATLSGSLSVVRNAINWYAAEHDNKFPDGANFADQLTKYTDISGNVSTTRTGDYKFGPYLMAVPACPVGDPNEPTGVYVDDTNNPPTPVPTNGKGWAYNSKTGVFIANTDSKDENDKKYSEY